MPKTPSLLLPTAPTLAVLLALGVPFFALRAAAPDSSKPAAADAPDDTAQVVVEPGRKFVYKQTAAGPQELEVYYPPDWNPGKNQVPGVLMFHGGSWTGGSLDQFRYLCKYLASRGLVAATANYRMVPKKDRAKLPAGESYKRICITDAKSAIRWMKQHAGELGIDPQQLIVGGGSAGGHIAVLATTNSGLDDSADPKDVDTLVAAYLLFNPAFQSADSDDSEVDFSKHLTAKFAPAIFFFGDGDRTFLSGAEDLLKQLRELGNSGSELWLAKGQKHGFFNKPPWQDVTLSQADRFLVEHGFLKGSGTLPPSPGGEKLDKAP